MPRYASDSRDKVRDAVDFSDLVGRYTELRRAGPGRLQGLCPFHDERTPSFGIEPDRKLYHCFGCGASGDLFTFVQEKEGLDFVAALEWLADRYGVQLEVADEDPGAARRRRERERLLELLDRTATFYARVLWQSTEAAAAREYLVERGLDEALLREFRVGFAPSAWDTVLLASRRAGFTESELVATGLAQRSREGRHYDRFRRRIVFPLADRRGQVLGFGARRMGEGEGPKYLNSPDGPVYHKGLHVYAADIARSTAARAGRVILAEGYTDVIALHQAGLREAVGLMGTALTAEQVAELSRLAKVVLLALDADGAGQQAMLRAAEVAAGRGVELRVIPLPEGLDPADYVARHGAGAMRDLAERSLPFVRFRVERALQSADLATAEGKDAAMAQLAPALAGIERGALRDDLVRLVADRTDRAASLVEQQVTAAPRPTQPVVAASPTRPQAGVVPPADGTQARTERSLLATCIAIPAAGAATLASADLDELLTVALHRRAADHLRAHLEMPETALPPDDPELAGLVAELVIRSGELAGSTSSALQAQLVTLRLVGVERAIKRARSEQTGDVAALMARRSELQGDLGRALEQAAAG